MNRVDKIDFRISVSNIDKIILVKDFLNITTTNFCSNDIIDVKDFSKLINIDFIDDNYFVEKTIICCEKVVTCYKEAISCFFEIFRKKIKTIIYFFEVFNKNLVNDSKRGIFNRLDK